MMHIQKVRVEGFRLLQDVEISLESTSTVIVGRNNSGKTSLTEVFECFTGEGGPRFQLEDFSLCARAKFIHAKSLRYKKEPNEDVLNALPKIALTLTFSYDNSAKDLGPLAPFIIDLDIASTTAIVRVEYAPILGTLHTLLDISSSAESNDSTVYFLRHLRNAIPSAYRVSLSAIDPTDITNRRDFDGFAPLSALIHCSFVLAQRTLDHGKRGNTGAIGKLLSTLFKTATASTAAEADQLLASKIKESVEGVERNVQHEFDGMLKQLLPALKVLGFQGLNDLELRPETTLNVEALLSDHTKVVYTGTDGAHLPEGYNGLGTRNLIYMLLQLESYHKVYRAKATRPITHLIFIEEPEAHLHPQMQEVFINQLNLAINKLSASYPDEPAWKVQFIITTHSPHVANAASFNAVRYFLNEPFLNTRQTKVKDFKKGMACISAEDQDFLHQYMTLTKCDLYFADKVIMVEGATERLLMPRLCQIVDQSLDMEKSLARQYITCVEAGGAHAHIFYPLLDFLELKTLVITDLDCIKPVIKTDKNGKQVTKWEKCHFAEGERVSNGAIKAWFRPADVKNDGKWQITPIELITKTDKDKLSGYRRIAYQIPEHPDSNICARSYEDALILANPDRFPLPKEDDEAMEAWELAQGLDKTETALRFAIYEKDWIAPRYIREGLEWLSENMPSPIQNAPEEDQSAVQAEVKKYEHTV